MEVAIGIIVWVVVIVFWVVVIRFFVRWRRYRSRALESSGAPASIGGALPRRETGSFQARVRWIEPSTDEDGIGHYRVEMRGRLTTPGAEGIIFRNEIFARTDASDLAPVHALLDWQRASGSVVFVDDTDVGIVPSDSFLNLREWEDVNLLMFPERLKGPYSGQRKLIAAVSVRTYGGAIVWSQDVSFVAKLPVTGYVEDAEREKVDDSIIARLAVAVAVVSGGINDEELGAIRDWSQARIGYLDDDDPQRTERAASLNSALTAGVSDAESDNLDLGATLAALVRDGSQSGRIEAVELALAVVSADGVANPEEMSLVNRIAERLEVDEVWFSEHRDKGLSGLEIAWGSGSDCATLLGIDPSAPPDEIRRKLNERYDRWSSRAVSVSDPEKRRKAEEMLEAVARCRQELLE